MYTCEARSVIQQALHWYTTQFNHGLIHSSLYPSVCVARTHAQREGERERQRQRETETKRERQRDRERQTEGGREGNLVYMVSFYKGIGLMHTPGSKPTREIADYSHYYLDGRGHWWQKISWRAVWILFSQWYIAWSWNTPVQWLMPF